MIVGSMIKLFLGAWEIWSLFLGSKELKEAIIMFPIFPIRHTPGERTF